MFARLKENVRLTHYYLVTEWRLMVIAYYSDWRPNSKLLWQREVFNPLLEPSFECGWARVKCNRFCGWQPSELILEAKKQATKLTKIKEGAVAKQAKERAERPYALGKLRAIGQVKVYKETKAKAEQDPGGCRGYQDWGYTGDGSWGGQCQGERRIDNLTLCLKEAVQYPHLQMTSYCWCYNHNVIIYPFVGLV